MATDRIEIYPGVTIEVSQRFRKRSGIGSASLLKRKMSDSERAAILEAINKREGRYFRKYSRLLLNEAVALSMTIGIKDAAKATGVKYWSVRSHRKYLMRKGKIARRYTNEKYLQCAELATKIEGTPGPVLENGLLVNWSQQAAFIEAGKQMGLNGQTVLKFWYQGERGLAQHRAAYIAARGFRSRTAKPQAQ